jgi:myo-inositol-1(or 4)-monophosphatase
VSGAEPEPEPATLLTLAAEAARAAGDELQRWFGDAGAVTRKSSSTDYVSEADRASEAVLVQRLQHARPHDAVLGEEGGERSGTSGLRWVVDPLDGTVNFLYGRRPWSVSVACVDDHGALVGVVHEPQRGEVFSAARGAGAALDGDAIVCNDTLALAQALVGTGFSYDRQARAVQGQIVARVAPAVGNLRRPGSAALDLCDVACGRLDAWYEDYLSSWDTAAGALIATEAGAAVRGFGERGLLVAAPSLADELHALITAEQAQVASR